MDAPAGQRTDVAGTRTTVAAETVAIVGLGYVGLPVAALARQKGYLVLGYDVDAEKVARIARGESPLRDPDVEAAFRTVPLDATTEARRLAEADVVIVAVPTPVDHEAHPDLRPLREAVAAVARCAKPQVLLSIESTINPGVCDEVIVPLLRSQQRDPGRGDPFLVHCPERVNPGDSQWTVRNIPRVLGGYTEEAVARGLSFYARILDAPVTRMSSLRAAEAVKIVENAFRDVNIAFVNELAQSFDRLGVDVTEVIAGAATKPFSFLPHVPGCGVGGHCIPVDPYYLIDHARSHGFDHKFLKLAREINRSMPRYTVERLKEVLQSASNTSSQGDIVNYTTSARRVRESKNQGSGVLTGRRIALLGLAYKRDVSDLRESPSLDIEKILREEGASVATFDPLVLEKSSATSLAGALQGADAVLLATDHTVFRKLRPSDLAGTPVRVIVDGRNCLDQEAFRAAGYTIVGVGR